MNETLVINGTTPVLEIQIAGPALAGVDEAQEMQAIAAESIGWWPLGDDAYLHASGGPDGNPIIISVVGLPQDAQEGVPTLLLV